MTRYERGIFTLLVLTAANAGFTAYWAMSGHAVMTGINLAVSAFGAGCLWMSGSATR